MFLNAVILILQEILEAVLLISVLSILTRLLQSHYSSLLAGRFWLLTALLPGVAGAWLYAWYMPAIAEWFDYVGQDVVNALIQLSIVALMLGFIFILGGASEAMVGRRLLLLRISIAGAVALVVMREGSEIILYIYGIMGQPGNLAPVLLGTLMATGIGLSCGVFLYFGLLSMPQSSSLRFSVILFALFAGNMGAQAVLLLTQADWLPYTAQVWDSSALIQESSISGQLLYALIGYDANPSLAQLLAYLAIMGAILASPFFRQAWQLQPAVQTGTTEGS